MFDAEIEICDEMRMHQEYVNIYKRFAPSNAAIIFDMRAELISRKNSVMEEFELYVKRKYGSDIPIVDRLYEKNKNKIFKFILFFFSGFSFVPNQRCLSLHMFFENGEHARRVMQPKDDEVKEN